MMSSRSREGSPLLPLGENLPPGLEFVAVSAKGANLYTADSRVFTDFIMGSGPLILGHAHPCIVEAVRRQAEFGTHFYANNEAADDLARLVVETVPCAEQVQLLISGTAATFYALRLARAFTGRERILQFGGAYHGLHDYGSQGDAADPERRPLASSVSDGIPRSVSDTVLVAPFNDLATTTAIVHSYADSIAAIMVEPIQRSLVPVPGFLQGLRDLCDQIGALLIFDEVVTGFRVAMGGAQELYGVTPDLCALGKALGAGMPIAAVTGRAEIMQLGARSYKKRGRVRIAGTFNGDPLSASAGLAALRFLREENGLESIRKLGETLTEGFLEIGARLSIPVSVIGTPALPEPLLTTEPVWDVASYTEHVPHEATSLLWEELIRRQIYVKPSAKWLVSTAHTSEDIGRGLDAFEDSLKVLKGKGIV